jgi:hypothetical protein
MTIVIAISMALKNAILLTKYSIKNFAPLRLHGKIVYLQNGFSHRRNGIGWYTFIASFN